MTEQVNIPSFRVKDLDDTFYFVGRLKEQTLESKDFDGKNGPFTKVSLRVVHERLDADTITPRYSFFPVPQNQVTPRSPLGQYITGMESAGTPVDFGGGNMENANDALAGPLGTIYVLCQRSIKVGRDTGREPDRFCLPIAQVGFGQDWEEEEAKRIISEARGVSANGVVKAAEQTIAEATAVAVPQAAPVVENTSTITLNDWITPVIELTAGQSTEEATRTAMVFINQNRSSIENGAQAVLEVAKGQSFWDKLQSEGRITIVDGTVTPA